MRLGIKNIADNIKAIEYIPGWAQGFSSSVYGNGVKAYLASAIAFRAIEIRTNAVSQGDLCLYDKNEEKIEKSPLIDLLWNPNADCDFVSLLENTESDLLVYGAAYWEKVRNGRGVVKELFRLNPSSVTPLINQDGIYAFQYSPIQGGKAVTLDKQDVVYFRGAYNPNNDLVGLAPLKFALVAALGEDNADKFLNSFFENGASPSLIMVSDNPMPPEGEVKRQIGLWEQLFKGIRNGFKTGFVWQGAKPYEVGTKNLKELALDTVRSELRKTICTAIGVPELLITPSNAADLTPVAMANEIFYSQTVLPRWRKLAEILNNQLLSEFPELVLADSYLEFETSGIKALNEDETKTAERLAMLVEKKIIKPEVAAIQLGFTVSDVPEEKAIPVSTGTVEMSIEPTVTGTVEQPVRSDLERWQTKALKAMRDGKSANVQFNTNEIDELEQTRIRNGLANCNTENDVRAVFSIKTEVKPEELLNALMDLARAVREHE